MCQHGNVNKRACGSELIFKVVRKNYVRRVSYACGGPFEGQVSAMSGHVSSALYGRAPELTRAVAALDRSVVHGRGAVLVVTGAAGIGKTALLQGVRDLALARGFVVGSAKADSVDEVAAGALILLALRSGDGPILDAAAFAQLATYYDARLWLAEQLADVLEKRAQTQPVLLALDDLQFADPVSRFLVRVLVDRLSGSPVVWVIARRGTWAQAVEDISALEQSDQLDVEHLAIGPLADGDVVALAADIIGTRTLTSTRRRQLLAAAGNPLLAGQVAREIAAGTSNSETSASLAASLRTRCHGLPAATIDLLRVTAVWGRPLDVADAAELLPTAAEHEVLERAAPAVMANLMDVSSGAVTFRHDLIREFFYTDLSRPARTALHRLCAEFLVSRRRPGVIEAAPHALACARAGDTEVGPMLRAAAARCVDSLPDTAVELSRAAFDLLLPGQPSWTTVGEELVELLVVAQRNAEAVEVVDRVLQRVSLADDRGRLQVLATRALWPMGRLHEIADRIETALSTPGLSIDVRARLTAMHALALTRLHSASAASATADRALEMTDGADPDVERVALEAKGLAARNETRYELARTQFRLLRLRFGPRYVSQEIKVLQSLDRYAEAQSLLDDATRDAGSTRDSRYPDLVTAQMWQDWHLGDFESVTVAAETVLRVSDELGTEALKIDAWTLMSIYSAFRLRLNDADTLVDRAARDATSDEVTRRPEITLARGYLATMRGQYAAAVSHFGPLMTDAAERHHYWPHSQEWPRLQAAAAVGARDTAFAAQCVAQAELLHQRNPGVVTLHGVALLTRGYVEQDTGTLERAVSLLDTGPRPMLRARALSDLGYHLARSDRHERAVPYLERALSIYEQLGVDLYQPRLRSVLGDDRREEGQPPAPRERPAFGWDSLTEAERTVGSLVADGFTNRAVAQSLSVSVHTINTHVRALFIKLDLHSRVQLANAWRARPERT